MSHRSTVLFEEVAKAAIPVIRRGNFNAQDLANTVNAFGKMSHRSAVLFEEVAKAAIPMIRKGDFNAQSLANTVNALCKMSHRSAVLFEEVAKTAIPAIRKGDFCVWDLQFLSLFWQLRDQLPSYMLFDKVSRMRYFGLVHSFFSTRASQCHRPAPQQYQQNLAACGFCDVGTSHIEELLRASGVRRIAPPAMTRDVLLQHYADKDGQESLFSR